MTIPTYDQFISPLLLALASEQIGLKARAAQDRVAAVTGLTETDRVELLPSGKALRFRNRISWAHDRLKRAGLSKSHTPGVWKLTQEGIALANTHSSGLPAELVQDLSKVKAGSTVAGATSPTSKPHELEPKSPEERIDEATQELDESISLELLEYIMNSSPDFFEQLVLDVLHALGYGATRSDLEKTGGSGDGGIDGIITMDPLGLEKIYVQAKRWKANISRPDIQSFFGALAGVQANKGIFLTTSSFSKEARNYASAVNGSIVLVDGMKLTSLMIEKGVGVSVERKIKLVRIDSDYFDDQS